jgi:4-amino-4-deoxy-L-arabinose transferase-like glycosyltransferase
MALEARGASPAGMPVDGTADTSRLTTWHSLHNDYRVAGALGGAALIIRLYLVVTSYCISADGVAYITMAREFYAGHPSRALAWIFSPLYPWLISLVYHILPNWELAAEILSLVFGTATVVLLYYLMCEVFERRAVAVEAAALAAIHPLLAALGASARTEAGYIALLTASVLLFVRAVRLRRIALAAGSGFVCGIGYLYRTEGIGVPVVLDIVLIAGALLWRRWSPRWGLFAAATLTIAFLVISSPYLLWMRNFTGHWTVGREVGVVTMEATGAATGRLERMRELGYRPSSSWLTALKLDPFGYAKKIGRDFLGSCYSLVQAIDPLLFVALLIGLWTRGKAIGLRWAEASLGLLIVIYFVGFVLTDTGPRLMIHVALLTFGWAAIGLETFAGWLGSWFSASRPVLRDARWGWIVAGVVVLSMLPRTLWPLGYDQRGMRYAAAEIVRRGGGPAVIAGQDVRTAFYAGAGFVRLPELPDNWSVCGWLAAHRSANYLMIDDREERLWGVSRGSACLSLIERYPRVGRTYYDLFAVSAVAARGGALGNERGYRAGAR